MLAHLITPSKKRKGVDKYAVRMIGKRLTENKEKIIQLRRSTDSPILLSHTLSVEL